MSEIVEKIDSSQMIVLSEFDYEGEMFNGTTHYAIGILDKDVLVRITTTTGWQSATFLYERVNHKQLLARIEDVYAGKLKDVPDVDYFEFKAGKDYLVIAVNSVMPHTTFAPIVSFNLINNREAQLDGRERSGFSLQMSLETGKKMLSEMKRIEHQVINF